MGGQKYPRETKSVKRRGGSTEEGGGEENRDGQTGASEQGKIEKNQKLTVRGGEHKNRGNE